MTKKYKKIIEKYDQLLRPLSPEQEAELSCLIETLSLRNKAIIEFMFSSGCRCSELAGIKLADPCSEISRSVYKRDK